MKIILAFCMLFLFQSKNTDAKTESKTGTLIFKASGFESDEGIAVVNLFRQVDDLPEKPFRTVNNKIKDGKTDIIFTDLAYGSYAAILYQDENNNGKLDHRLFMPAEPMAFTNNWELSLFSGMPSFEKLKFKFTADSSQYELVIE